MISLHVFQESDIAKCYDLKYGKNADLTWMAYNAPYFLDPVLTEEKYQKYCHTILLDKHHQVIVVDGMIVGEVSAHWTDGKLKQWLEVGIVIYHPSNWGRGIGKKALRKWLNYLFHLHQDIEHIGFTTWSGNIAMIQLGEKTGMVKEGVMRKVRYWQGHYYDSIKYGILRDELS